MSPRTGLDVLCSTPTPQDVFCTTAKYNPFASQSPGHGSIRQTKTLMTREKKTHSHRHAVLVRHTDNPAVADRVAQTTTLSPCTRCGPG